MENKDTREKHKNPILIKIIIPILILVLIGSLYLFKNWDNIKATDSKKTPQTTLSTTFDLNVTEPIDLEKLKSYGLPIIIDFGADSCIPCKEMAPVLVKLNEELQGKAIILFVDVWKYQNLYEGFPVKIIPTQVFYDSDGNPFIPPNNLGTELIMYTSQDSGEHIFTAHEGGISEGVLRRILEEMGVEK